MASLSLRSRKRKAPESDLPASRLDHRTFLTYLRNYWDDYGLFVHVKKRHPSVQAEEVKKRVSHLNRNIIHGGDGRSRRCLEQVTVSADNNGAVQTPVRIFLHYVARESQLPALSYDPNELNRSNWTTSLFELITRWYLLLERQPIEGLDPFLSLYGLELETVMEHG